VFKKECCILQCSATYFSRSSAMFLHDTGELLSTYSALHLRRYVVLFIVKCFKNLHYSCQRYVLC
jgi:hypothetical protein